MTSRWRLTTRHGVFVTHVIVTDGIVTEVGAKFLERSWLRQEWKSLKRELTRDGWHGVPIKK